MALSVITDLATGDLISESWLDDIRLNLNEHKTFAEGASPFPGTIQKFGGDANFYLQKLSNIVYLGMDAGDGLYFNRTTNTFNLFVGGIEKLGVDGNGLIQTAAFESSEQTITAGSTANIAHGLGIRPRFFGALYGTTSGLANCTNLVIPSFNTLGSFVRMSQVGGTNLVVVNGTAVTIYVYAFALR